MENSNIYKKLQQARDNIRESNLTKLGHNTFSSYDYYTPEQISALVSDACKKAGLMTLFNFYKDEHGYKGVLTVLDVDNPESLCLFTMASDIPVIKATNATQQIGGAVTYTERYLCMSAFEIKDNNLDLDTGNGQDKKPAKKEEPKNTLPWLNKFNKDKTENTLYKRVLGSAKEKGTTIKELEKYYKIHTTVKDELIKDGLN